MNGRERIIARLCSKPVDHIPVMPITMMFAAQHAGCRYRDYVTDHRVLVDAQLRVAEKFGFDYVSAISDPAREAADLGARTEFFDDQPPALPEDQALLADKSHLLKLSLPEPCNGPRMSDRIAAIRMLRERAGNDLLIEGWVEGPCAEAADLRGINALMLDFHDDPVFVRDLFEFCLLMEAKFARTQIAAGADIIGIGDAAASLIGPKLYAEFVWQYECRLIEKIHLYGAYARLHICGNTKRIVDGMGRTKADIVDIDFPVPVTVARAAIPGGVLLGNLEPAGKLRTGTPDDVRSEIAACHLAAGERYVAGAGCEICRDTPDMNVAGAHRLRADAHVSFHIRLEPSGTVLEAADGTPLRDLLFPYGTEFPCGGQGTCGRCKVRTGGGDSLLACRTEVHSDLVLHIGDWTDTILTNASAPVPRGIGRGIAVDLGTTTVVAQLIDGPSGQILGTRAELNQQAIFGSDVMSRIEHALRPGGQAELQQLIVAQVRRMAAELSEEPVPVVVAGNTAMHHLFGGIPVDSLSRAPFEPVSLDEVRAPPGLRFLPPVGGFVGSDVLAGIVATQMHESTELGALLDLGTNGEIVVGSRGGLYCTSTAAGPAFEGGRISCGMRAATGAIAGIDSDQTFQVLGGGPATGICGSGLVDATALALECGTLSGTGRIQTTDRTLRLRDQLCLVQSDIRELQLAKAAIAAGLELLLKRLGADVRDLRRVYLAGAFGNYVRQRSAWRIGLFPYYDERIVPVGNSSLAGARLALFSDFPIQAIMARTTHVPLHTDPEFQELFVAHMAFPHQGWGRSRKCRP